MDTAKLIIRLVALEQKIDSMIGLTLISQKEVLTLGEAALYSGYQPSTLYKHIRESGLPSYCPAGKKIYIRRVDLVEWLLRNREE